MQSTILNKENSTVTFNLKSKNSWIHIKRIVLEGAECTNWTEYCSDIKLGITLRHMVNIDKYGRFIDDRTKEFSINLKLHPYQEQPVFDINQRIENETFTIGQSNSGKCFSVVSFVLQNSSAISSKVSVKIEMTSFDI